MCFETEDVMKVFGNDEGSFDKEELTLLEEISTKEFCLFLMIVAEISQNLLEK